MPIRRRAASVIALHALALAVAGCGNSSPSPSAASSSRAADLSPISCASRDSGDVGALTGAWQGNDSGIYYIRQVGDCLWWFGTELREIEPGVTRQPGFANVASGRVNGNEVVVEWADVPMGNNLNGGGLTLVYDAQADQLEITERRGTGEAFGGTAFTRIDPDEAPSPSVSASP